MFIKTRYVVGECSSLTFIRMKLGKLRRDLYTKFLLKFRKSYVKYKLKTRKGFCSKCGDCCRFKGLKCPYLKNNLCTIQERKPEACKLFPIDEIQKNNKCTFFWDDVSTFEKIILFCLLVWR